MEREKREKNVTQDGIEADQHLTPQPEIYPKPDKSG